MPDGGAQPAALIVCPLCQQRHVVRANEPPVPLACGGTAQVIAGRRQSEAWVWPEHGNARRRAAIITLSDI